MIPVLGGLAFAEPETKPRGRVQDSHPLRWPRLTTERAFHMSEHEEAVRATLLWGVEGVDRSGDWGWATHLLRTA